MSTTALIRKAKALSLNGAAPGASAIVAKLIAALEGERALRLRLQREANRARAVATQMEDRVAELREFAAHPAVTTQIAAITEAEAVALERFAQELRASLTSDAEPGA